MENEFEKILELQTQKRDMDIQHWLKHEFLTWQWFFGVALIFAPLIIWWLAVDKKRLVQIAFFGCFVIALAVFLDVAGSNFVFWAYPIRIIPQTPLLFPVDIVDLPFALMFLYQKFPKWGKFLVFNTIVAAVMAFILEPLAVMVRVYQLIHWRFIYSFPIYIAIAVLAKALTDFFMQVQNRKSKGA